MIQAQEIEIKKLTPNKGQIAGVPTNPRTVTRPMRYWKAKSAFSVALPKSPSASPTSQPR